MACSPKVRFGEEGIEAYLRETAITKMNKIIKLIPFPVRESIRVLLFGKNHHQDLVRFVKSIGAETMFDIGAEAGYETILAAKAGIKVCSFEPNPGAVKTLEANVRAEKISHLVTIVPKALSDFEGQADFYFAEQNTLVPVENAESTKVQVTTLAAFIKETRQFPDFVKVDAEGANLGVIKGFPFELHKPRVFSIEYEAHEREIDTILRENGYGFVYALYRPVRKDHRAIFWKYSNTPDFVNGVWGDIIAMQPNDLEQFRKLAGLS